MKKFLTPALACAAASAVLASIACAGYVAAQPRFGEGTYAVLPEGENDEVDTSEHEFSYPLKHWRDGHAVQGNLRMELGSFHATIFRVYPDDCLELFRVNDGWSTDGSEYCDYTHGHDLDWSEFVSPGENTVYFRIRNHSNVGGFRLTVSPWDPIAFVMILCALASIALLCASSFLHWGRTQQARAYLSIFWAGSLLRLVYVIRTPFNVRAYDFDGHVDYLVHVLRHFSVPHAQDGWQYYQPPLYYFLNALFLSPLKVLGATEDSIIRVAQFLSFGISCAALAIAGWVAVELFRNVSKRRYAYAFFALVAAFPGIVFMASRISNDTLIVPLSFAFLGFLLRWWRTGAGNDALWAAVMIGLGLLTKSNFLAFLPVLALAVLLRAGVTFREKVRLGALSLAILVALVGWYAVLRIGMERERHLVGNIGSNAPGLRVELAPANFFVFRPHEVLRVPYAHAWSDHAGRNRFWEHLLKTSLTGEWDFGFRTHAVTRVMLAVGMVLLAVAIGRGLYVLWFDAEATVVLWSTSIFLLFTMMALLIVENVGGFQDFRYVPGLVVPVTWYMLDGIRVLPRAARMLLMALFCTFIALCAPFYFVLLS